MLSQRVIQLENRLHSIIRHRLSTLRHFLASKVGSRGFVVAEAQVRRLSQRVDDLEFRLQQVGRSGSLLRARAHRLELFQQQLTRSIEQSIQKSKQSFVRVAGTLDALSPLAVLERGYAICQTSDGRVIRQADALELQSVVKVRLSRGSLTAVVTGTSKQQ
jgi:exodeoxyribonuclease VII large subunit